METIKFLYNHFRRYRWQILFLGAISLVSSVIGGLGIGALIPLLSLLKGGGDVPNDLITQFILGFFSYLPFSYTLYSLLAVIVILFFLRALISLCFMYARSSIIYSYKVRTLSELFDGVLRAKWSFLLKQKMGYMQNIFILDIDRSSKFLGDVAHILLSGVSALIFLGFAVTISAEMSLLVMAGGAIMFFSMGPLLRRLKIVVSQLSLENRNITHFVGEHLMGLKNLKIAAAMEEVNGRAGRYFKNWRDLEFKNKIIEVIIGSSFEPMAVVFISLALIIFHGTPGFRIEVFAAVIFLTQRFFLQIQGVVGSLQGLAGSVAHARLVAAFSDELKANQEESTPGLPFAFEKELSFEGVDFSYSSRAKILQNVSFTIHKGEIVGLIGPSGAGKTSIADLMLRLFEPGKGRILLDGVDSREFAKEEWRRHIGYVSQDHFLLNDSIERNITFYKKDIDRESVTGAAKKASILDFIHGLPDSFETTVGDRGIMLSGGQRQRVVLARALVRRPQILILDEATSALDNESEAKIQEAVQGLRGQSTVFIIAHRLTTVMDADRLLVLDKGRIIEEGKPHDLLKNKDSYFYRMYNLRG